MDKKNTVEGKDKLINLNGALLDNNEPVKRFVAPIIICLFIILGLILWGLYYWYSLTKEPVIMDINPSRPTLETNKEPETPTATAQVESLTVMSTSDELNALEADLLSTDLDSLQTEINQIEAELVGN